jgi:enterochelin esterase-like enzyme
VLAPLVATAAALALPLQGFHVVGTGPDGGVVFAGRIPNRQATWDRRESQVYLPPGFDETQRYPVVYLLHGLPGKPSEFTNWLRLADVADGLITGGEARPFIAVIPVAGTPGREKHDEWAGVWEDYVVRDVVPWTDAHLPTIASPAGRTIGGVSAGGYGAVDIGLRHPRLFATIESSGGYFVPFRDGPFVRASQADLDAHSPVVLVRREAPLLRRLGVRILLASGGNHGGVYARWTTQFAAELSELGVAHRLWTLPQQDTGHFWRVQVAESLRFAFR